MEEGKNRMKQKENLELCAIQNFIVEYNCGHKRNLVFEKQCLPSMPDTICRLNKKEIGIEIAHTYGMGEEAAMRLGNREYEDFAEEIHISRRMIPFNYRGIGSLSDILASKGTKKYSFNPTWLIIRNAFFLYSLTDYKKLKSEIIVPQIHPFDQIWLLCDENSVGKHGIMKLF